MPALGGLFRAFAPNKSALELLVNLGLDDALDFSSEETDGI